jgi:hypothetical protein
MAGRTARFSQDHADARLSNVTLPPAPDRRCLPPGLISHTPGAVIRTAAILLSLSAIAGLTGCANPGVPRPPSLHLPKPVADLTAARIGDHVDLRWTAPDRTTDDLDFTSASTVEICRDPTPPSARPSRRPAPDPPCTVVSRLPGHAGISLATDPLPSNLTTGSVASLTYRVRVLNSRGRGASPSNPALVLSGPGLPPLQGFRATQTGRGILLQWQSTSNTGPNPTTAVEVLRTLQPGPGAAGPARPATKQPASAKSARPNSPAPPLPLTPRASTEVRLRAVSTSAADPGGMLDTDVQLHQTYVYSAQRVRMAPVPASAGQKLELRSEPTEPIQVARADTFPPGAPRGLVSVPGILPGSPADPATAHSGVTLDLSWQPDTEVDLAGYLVFRSELAPTGPTQPVQLTPELVQAPAYRDATVLPGHRYRYFVVAVDQSGNRSAPSAPIDDTPQAP